MPHLLRSLPLLALTAALASCGTMAPSPALPASQVQEGTPENMTAQTITPKPGSFVMLKALYFGDLYTRVRDVAVQADGKILIVGEGRESGAYGGYFGFVARVLPDGSLDPTFAKMGWRKLQEIYQSTSWQCAICPATYHIVTGNSPHEFTVTGVAIQGNRVLVSGSARKEVEDSSSTVYRTRQQFVEAFKLSDGSADGGWNSTGIVQTTMGNDNVLSNANDIAVAPDRVFTSGYVNSSPMRPTIATYTNAGQLDKSFSGDGAHYLTLPNSEGGASSSAVTMVNSRPLVAGWAKHNNIQRMFLTRYKEDGTLDPSFGGGDGILGLSFGTGDTVARAVQYNASAGRIGVAGQIFDSAGLSRFAVAKLFPDGTVDAAFGSGGKVTTVVGTGHAGANAAVMQPNGKLLAAGYTTSPDGKTDAAVVRYNANGTLDAAFGSGGKSVLGASNGFTEMIRGMATLPDGRIVVVGDSGIYGLVGLLQP
ncbi:hypothetical protein [Deinococcus humi]|uniref:Putative delta-60 repeat protein n=1 Tax=Deinococcus humi TaxID=662880 RepID=A0A7W8JYN8_9DEIO|nr:hypothetical protein [Deinococcus humi]MBB5365228.1 putative delta-60 repeat protein [Deinococcus humi]GGO35683.1 hypothetical protein GCM10008949_38550 [Deinococcus humi]